ncbi:hypothetical protein AKJ16_DCAP24104 [Drosera capensis]
MPLGPSATAGTLCATWKDSDRVLVTPMGFAGEHGADLDDLKPIAEPFHMSCIVLSNPNPGFQVSRGKGY